MKLSAYLIVKNEEAVIAKCLARLKDFDEIIVVDTGSIDRTPEICRLLNTDGKLLHGKIVLNVDHFAWIDDFAVARNFAASLCTGDWLFPIDADNEIITGRKKIEAEIRKAEKKGAVCCNIRAQFPAGNWHWVSGLHKLQVKFVGAVHECFDTVPGHNADVTIQIGQSPAKAADPDRNVRILLKSDLQAPRNLFYLGKECYERGRFGEAVAWMHAYRETRNCDPREYHWSWLVTAYSYWRDGSGRGDKAREAAMEAFRQNPASKETIRLLAEMHGEPWRSRWLRLEAAADNEGVLFVR